MQNQFRILTILSAGYLLAACSASEEPNPTNSSGGKSASSGGATSAGANNANGGSSTNNPSGGNSSASGGSNSANGGATGSGGNSSPSGGSSAGGNTSSGGATTSAGGASNGGAGTSGGMSATNGGSNAGGSAGSASKGGATSTGGASNGGSNANGGASSGGATGSGGSGVVVSPSCKAPTWPTATGSTVTISGTKSITTYDGKGALHEGTLEDCSSGNQSSTEAMFEVADGGSIKNVIFGKKVGDGIHCLGSCTIDNVWFANVCDDAITMLGGSGKTMTISNSGFKNARDKTIQHNGTGSTVNISNVYVETAGKLYRSCGDGCSGGARTVTLNNIIAIGVDQIAGVSTNDKATLSNICAYRTSTLCDTYAPGSETKATNGANGTNEGPSTNCIYKGSDTHALVDRVSGSFSTDVLCTGANSAKSGSTATACVSGFDTCLKPCAPGAYGFKQLSCVGGKYSETGGCALPSDASIAAHFASSNASSATSSVSKNGACTSQWAWAKDSSTATNYCMCVMKPGYYQASSGWYVWDCQSQWW